MARVAQSTAVGKKAVTVKFDHDKKEHAVEKVKRRFFVMKYISVYRKQFPLVLAYPVTSQGLSLDCAILDAQEPEYRWNPVDAEWRMWVTECSISWTQSHTSW